MKLPKFTHAIAILALTLAAFPATSQAQLLTFDAKGMLESVKILKATKQQLDSLGKILGVSTEQLQQLQNMKKAIGTAQNVAEFGDRYSPNQLMQKIKTLPGMQGVDMDSVFKTSGALDVFGGVPTGQWKAMMTDPYNYYAQSATGRAITNAGKDAGMTKRETDYINWVKRQNPDYLNKRYASQRLSDLMLTRWASEAEDRRNQLQVLSETTNELADGASKADTLIEQGAGNAQLLNAQVKVSIAAANQANSAAEQQIQKIKDNNSMLSEQLAKEDLDATVRAINWD